MKKLTPPTRLYEDVRALVLSARDTIARGVDLLQVHTNYQIGRRIVEQEQQGTDRAEYGRDLLNNLSARLTKEFGNGFSRSNLEYMRRFYLAYPARGSRISQTVSGILKGPSKSQTLSGISRRKAKPLQPPFVLSWSHYVFLMNLQEEERSFYEIESAQQGWTLRELKRQFDAGLYERLALSRNRKSVRALAVKGQHVARPQDLLKEPYVLEFLGLQEKASFTESDLEQL